MSIASIESADTRPDLDEEDEQLAVLVGLQELCLASNLGSLGVVRRQIGKDSDASSRSQSLSNQDQGPSDNNRSSQPSKLKQPSALKHLSKKGPSVLS